MTIMALARKGYGSIRDLNELDTPEFLDMVEYEHICSDIERHLMEKR